MKLKKINLYHEETKINPCKPLKAMLKKKKAK
jgi:hypothetical protein